jgi:xylulokinase
MPYLIGIDVGTTGAKALLIDEKGRVAARSTREYVMHTPRPLWAEQDPADWWNATVQAIRDLLDASRVKPAEIAALGLSGQMHGSVFLDPENKVIRPAILWCDQRTEQQCEWINEKAGRDVVVGETCNPVLTGFTAPKIIWLRQNEPENYARVRKVLLPKDYIRFLLTGEFATEVSDASGTSLLNVSRRAWSEKLLEAIEMPRDFLPPVFESQEVSSHISAEAARLTGLRQGTPVVGGAGDQAGGAVGNGIVRPGVISVTTGTSGVVFASMDRPEMDPGLRLHTFCHAVPGKWHVMGVMLSAGGSLRWFRDAVASEERSVASRLGLDPYELLTSEAEAIPAGSEGLVFLPYLTGERTPHADPAARGVFFGLTLVHGRAHMARSILEGVAFGLRDSLEIMRQMELPIHQVRASGGGARSRLWRQIQSDVDNCELVTINVDEGPAFGVALLAAVGAGIYPTVESACDATITLVDKTSPDAGRARGYEKLYGVYRSLYPALKQLFRELPGVSEAEP